MDRKIDAIEFRIGGISDLFLTLGGSFPLNSRGNLAVGEGNVSVDEGPSRRGIELCAVKSTLAPLNPPLLRAMLVCNRHGGTYDAGIMLYGESGKEFPLVSKRLAFDYKNKWFPIRPEDGSGDLTIGSSKSSNVLSVQRLKMGSSNSYLVSLGDGGVTEVVFDRYDLFEEGMEALAKAASSVATACIRPSDWEKPERQTAQRYELVTLERQLSF